MGVFPLFKGLLAIPGYIMSVTVWGVGVMCAAAVEKVEARYASDHPATHETAHSREVSAPNPAALSTEPRSREQGIINNWAAAPTLRFLKWSKRSQME